MTKARKTERSPRARASSKHDDAGNDGLAAEQPSADRAQGKKTRAPKTTLVKLRYELHDSEARLLEVLKQSLSDTGFAVKKSQLLRVGIGLLLLQSPEMLKSSKEALATWEARRPKQVK